MAVQYSAQFCDGAAFTAAYCRAVGAKGVSRGLSGWNRAGIKPQHPTANPLTALLSVCIRKAAANGSLFFMQQTKKCSLFC